MTIRTKNGGDRPGRLVGRMQELAELIRSIEDALRGPGRAIWIAGPEGIGKTRLIEEALRYAAWRGLRCLVETPPLSRERADSLFSSVAPAASAARLVVLDDARDHLGLASRMLLPRGICLIAAGESALTLPRDLVALRPFVLPLRGLSSTESIALVRRHGRETLGPEDQRTIRTLAGHPGRLIAWARSPRTGPHPPGPKP